MIGMHGSFGSLLATISLLSMTEVDPGRIEIPATHRVESNFATGLQHFEQKGLRGLFYVPHSYRPDEPLPLLILLHGGGHHASDWFGSYSRRAERGRFIIVAPDSFGRTWGSTGDYGPDVSRINGALAVVFSRYAIDPGRIIVGGFSDGASYALSFGLFNGDRIRGVIPFSPGSLNTRQGRGHPSFFISHGLQDTMLPIEGSRSFVALLRSAGLLSLTVNLMAVMKFHPLSPMWPCRGPKRSSKRTGKATRGCDYVRSV